MGALVPSVDCSHDCLHGFGRQVSLRPPQADEPSFFPPLTPIHIDLLQPTLQSLALSVFNTHIHSPESEALSRIPDKDRSFTPPRYAESVVARNPGTRSSPATHTRTCAQSWRQARDCRLWPLPSLLCNAVPPDEESDGYAPPHSPWNLRLAGASPGTGTSSGYEEKQETEAGQ